MHTVPFGLGGIVMLVSSAVALGDGAADVGSAEITEPCTGLSVVCGGGVARLMTGIGAAVLPSNRRLIRTANLYLLHYEDGPSTWYRRHL